MELAAGEVDPSHQEPELSAEPQQEQQRRRESAQPVDLVVQNGAPQDALPISQRPHRARAVVRYFPSSCSQLQATLSKRLEMYDSARR